MAKRNAPVVEEEIVDTVEETTEEVVEDGKEITISFRTFKGNAGVRTFTDKKAAKEFQAKFNGTIV